MEMKQAVQFSYSCDSNEDELNSIIEIFNQVQKERDNQNLENWKTEAVRINEEAEFKRQRDFEIAERKREEEELMREFIIQQNCEELERQDKSDYDIQDEMFFKETEEEKKQTHSADSVIPIRQCTSDSEDAVMWALENGHGDYYGFD